MCGFQTCTAPGLGAPASCMAGSHLPGWQSPTLATCTSSCHHPTGCAPWPCALTSNSHPDLCSWREPLPVLPWLRVLMSPCHQRLFRTDSLLLGSCAHLQHQTQVVELLNPELWPSVSWLKAAAACWAFCRVGSAYGRELIIFQLVCTGAEQEGTKRNSQESEAWESMVGRFGGRGRGGGMPGPWLGRLPGPSLPSSWW